MAYHDILAQYTFSPRLAEAYGFIKTEDGYELCRAIGLEDFQAVIRVNDGNLEVHVVELPERIPYMPFSMATSQGAFVSRVREHVDQLLEEVISRCFEFADVREDILRYAKKRFGTIPDEPWGKTPRHQKLEQVCTLKTARRCKWYAILMRIPYASLGMEQEGSVDVMNVKGDPAHIPMLVDQVHYFPAYHMNKKHWLTILLDRETDMVQIKTLLERSYALAEKSS